MTVTINHGKVEHPSAARDFPKGLPAKDEGLTLEQEKAVQAKKRKVAASKRYLRGLSVNQ